MTTQITILHYNDVYNVDATSTREPIGGAARFLTAVKSFSHLDPLILFSGDAFSPSMRKFLRFTVAFFFSQMLANVFDD